MGQISFDGGKYDVEELPAINKVPIESILKQGSERFVLQTSQGTVVMKHITKRMKLHIDVIRAVRYPGIRELEQEAQIVYPIALAEGADDNAIAEANRIASQLAPTLDLYALGVIEYPFLTTPDDLEAFLASLKEDEQEAMRQMLTVLTRWNYPVDYSSLEIAERFHVQMVTADLIENPTYEQYRALYAVVTQEHEATKRMYSKLGVLK